MFRSQGKCGGGHPDNLPKGTLYCLKQNTFRIIHRSLGKSEPGRKWGGRAGSGGLSAVGVRAGGGADRGGRRRAAGRTLARYPTRSLSGPPPAGARQCGSIPHSRAARPAARQRSPKSVDAPIGRRKACRGSALGLPGRPVAHAVRPDGSAGGGGAGFSQFPVRPGPAPHLPPAPPASGAPFRATAAPSRSWCRGRGDRPGRGAARSGSSPRRLPGFPPDR